MTFKIAGMTFICNNREEYDKELISSNSFNSSNSNYLAITISNLPSSITCRELEAMFTFAPGFKSATLLGIDGTGSISFTNRQDAINASAFLNGYKYQGHVLQIKDDFTSNSPLSFPSFNFNSSSSGSSSLANTCAFASSSSISSEDNYSRFRRMSCNDGLLLMKRTFTPPCIGTNSNSNNGNNASNGIMNGSNNGSIVNSSISISSSNNVMNGSSSNSVSNNLFGLDLLEQTRKQFDLVNNQDESTCSLPRGDNNGLGITNATSMNMNMNMSINNATSNMFKKERYENAPCNTIYVGNLPFSATESELLLLFHNMPGFKRLCFRHKININSNIGIGSSVNGIANLISANSNGNMSNVGCGNGNVNVNTSVNVNANANANGIGLYDGSAVKNGPMCFVEFVDVNYATKAMKILDGTMLQCSIPEKGGIRLSYSKNPLGVRSSNGNIASILNSNNINNVQSQQHSNANVMNISSNGNGGNNVNGNGIYPWTGCLAL